MWKMFGEKKPKNEAEVQAGRFKALKTPEQKALVRAALGYDETADDFLVKEAIINVMHDVGKDSLHEAHARVIAALDEAEKLAA